MVPQFSLQFLCELSLTNHSQGLMVCGVCDGVDGVHGGWMGVWVRVTERDVHVQIDIHSNKQNYVRIGDHSAQPGDPWGQTHRQTHRYTKRRKNTQ